MRTHLFKWFFPFAFIGFISCSLFETTTSLTVSSCSNPSQFTIVDTVKYYTGKVQQINAVVDSVPVQRWVILPDQDLNAIYEPCNLPYQARQKNQKVTFSGYILSKIPAAQDTLLYGTTYFELISITTHD